MLEYLLSFLVLLNPFALFIYMLPLKKERGVFEFMQILLRASLISGAIYILFALLGTKIFSVLNVDFEAFRIFGGVVLVAFAMSFIVQGKQSMITTRGELSKIASEVALPFIVGAGTITLSIIIGDALTNIKAVATIVLVMTVNFIIITFLAFIRQKLKQRLQIVFDKNAEILLRINGFIVGAYGVDLIVAGIKNIF